MIKNRHRTLWEGSPKVHDTENSGRSKGQYPTWIDARRFGKSGREISTVSVGKTGAVVMVVVVVTALLRR
jgi:hypothetical protein